MAFLSACAVMDSSSVDDGRLRAEYDRLIAAHDLLKEKHAAALSELEEALSETQNVLAETKDALALAHSLDSSVRIECGTSSETVEGGAAALPRAPKPSGGSSRVAPARGVVGKWRRTKTGAARRG